MIKIKKGDKIRIQDNLMEELIKHGFNKAEMEGFVNRFKGTDQEAFDVYHDDDTGTDWVTVDMCCEIPVSAITLPEVEKNKFMKIEEIKDLWGEDLYNAFWDKLDDEGFLTQDWAPILEDKYPDHTYYMEPEIKENLYSRMYNLDFEENTDGTRIRPE